MLRKNRNKKAQQKAKEKIEGAALRSLYRQCGKGDESIAKNRSGGSEKRNYKKRS